MTPPINATSRTSDTPASTSSSDIKILAIGFFVGTWLLLATLAPNFIAVARTGESFAASQGEHFELWALGTALMVLAFWLLLGELLVRIAVKVVSPCLDGNQNESNTGVSPWTLVHFYCFIGSDFGFWLAWVASDWIMLGRVVSVVPVVAGTSVMWVFALWKKPGLDQLPKPEEGDEEDSNPDQRTNQSFSIAVWSGALGILLGILAVDATQGAMYALVAANPRTSNTDKEDMIYLYHSVGLIAARIGLWLAQELLHQWVKALAGTANGLVDSHYYYVGAFFGCESAWIGTCLVQGKPVQWMHLALLLLAIALGSLLFGGDTTGNHEQDYEDGPSTSATNKDHLEEPLLLGEVTIV